jgi:hypothetical protein
MKGMRMGNKNKKREYECDPNILYERKLYGDVMKPITLYS